MLPEASAAGPAPDIQMPPPPAVFGTKLMTPDCWSVSALFAITHEEYGPASQCEVHVVKIVPPSCRRAARSLYCFGSKTTFPLELFAPEPGYVAVIVVGPPKSSFPVVRSSACNR